LEDEIVVTEKLHGTSIVLSNLLVKKKFNIVRWVKSLLGFNVRKYEYRKLYSSRKVLKGIEGLGKSKGEGYYKEDVYRQVFDRYKDIIPKGVTLYGEVVGYTKDGGHIQKNYDYGCKPNENKLFIYRITNLDDNGRVVEWDWNRMKRFEGIELVPEIYKGELRHFLGSYNDTLDEFLQNAMNLIEGKSCSICKNKVPREGICVRNESGNLKAFKLKSKSFLEHETKTLDKGETVKE
jgi:hypothetical protein